MQSDISLLVVVKAYPNPSVKYFESSCVAGIRTDLDAPEWVRLYPVPFRLLESDKQFKKYQFLSLQAEKGSDTRPESLRPNLDTLSPGEWLDSRKAWARRKTFVEPLAAESMCGIQTRRETHGASLGAFRPAEVTDFYWEHTDAATAASKRLLASRQSLFAQDQAPLEILPYRFKYKFRCSDNHCRNHDMTIVDWEVGQAFRNFRPRYGEIEGLKKMRSRFLDEMCGSHKDTIFFTGNTFVNQNVFLILGIFWPPASTGE
jgi:hypothetical protein